MGESGLPSPLPRAWRWWEDGAHGGATNMATDQALLATVRADTGTWRWYGWAQPTVSFGRNERIVGRYTPEALAVAGVDAVRRPTGGRALFHWRELTYSVTVPLPAAVPWRHAYDAINRLLLDTLLRVGVDARLSTQRNARTPDGPVCFDAPAEGEITVEERKLVGSAVWRQGDAYLQHGSILLHDDQPRLATMGAPADAPLPPAATLAACLPAHTDDALRRRVIDSAREVVAQQGAITSFVADDSWHDMLALQHRHFADHAWLWRR
ncbi:hypothetical protein [Gemmatimonas sp.]|uniref:lipoate--protein ligase family protein n=1 Tax=Gemmatimonas sp. TaxID=1962908 RepID=UPI00333E195F